MRLRRPILFAIPVLLSIASGVAVAQYRRFGPGPTVIPEDRAGVQNWPVDERFKHDLFTFVRIEYTSGYGGGGFRGGGFGGGGFGGGGMFQMIAQPGGMGPGFRGRGRGGRGFWGGNWRTDWPDSDLNFSFRLQQLTSLKVNPVPIIRKLTDPDLCDYPFIYIIEPGRLVFSEEERKKLRHYLLNGGFLMVDDFWGQDAWDNFYQEITQVFPDERNQPVELDLSHEIFQCVYRLKEKPQVNNAEAAWWGRDQGITWEDHGDNSQNVHYWGMKDDKGRLMAIICHNTDLGDGWEREGDNEWYFHEFSEKKAYPMGINIVTYAMTH